MSVTQRELLDLYRVMVKIRCFEERARIEFLEGGMPGFLHLYSGEEAIAAGVTSILRPDDYVTSNHRGHGHMIAKGADIRRMMAEIYGKVDGYCKGKGGSMHYAAEELGLIGANGVVGGGFAIATGAGFTCKYLGLDRVSICYFGDASSNRGTFHESLNLASIWDLPVVYVCENNLYGVANCQRDYMKLTDVADRAASYGFPGVVVDGNDVLAVREAALEAVTRAREGGGPTIVECKTWRHYGHYIGDAAGYRDPEEHKKWLERDPILNCQRLLTAKKWATKKDFAEIEAEMNSAMDEAVEFAKRSPLPSLADLETDLFAD